MIAALLLTTMLTLDPAPCAPDLIHYMPFCLTPAEYAALTAPPPVIAAPVVTGVEQWRSMVDYYWGKHGATDRMLRIMQCESSGDPNAYNPGHGEKGLFQIHPLWQRDWPGNYYDPWTNAAVAYQIWLGAGLRGSPYQPWACRNW